MLKVAFITRATLFTAPGGDTIQIVQIARQLSTYGIIAEIRLANETIDYDQYDLLHLFNLTRPADLLIHARKAKKPYVITPIFVNYSEYDKYHRTGFSRILFRYFSADAIEYMKTMARRVFNNQKLASPTYSIKGQRNTINEILRHASLLLPNSESEYNRIAAKYDCQVNYRVIPNGIDRDLFHISSTIIKDRQLVLCVGRIEGIKNQINLIKALNNTRFKLIIIGSPAPNQRSYYNRCRKIASSNVHFIDHISQEALIPYYQKAGVHILPSWFETTGLSSLEAAVLGCNIVISNKGDAKEYFGEDAIYCNPGSPPDIFAAIAKASTGELNKNLRKKILLNYSWQQATVLTLNAYESIIHRYEIKHCYSRNQGHP